MNNESPKLSLEQIKKYITIATILLVSLCAFLGIIMIFIGSNLTVMNVIWTLLIMYLVLVYSTNNIARLSDQLPIVRILSCLALGANVFWSILWILLVWDVFGGPNTDLTTTTWKVVGSAIVISVFCTILSAKIAKLYYLPTIMKFFKSLPLVCAAFLGIDILLVIWFDGMDEDLIFKFILAELILVALQAIVGRILINNATRLGINTGMPQNFAPTAPTSSETAQISNGGESANNCQPTTQPQPANPAPTPKQRSILSIIGAIALIWIGLSIVIPVIVGLLFLAR